MLIHFPARIPTADKPNIFKSLKLIYSILRFTFRILQIFLNFTSLQFVRIINLLSKEVIKWFFNLEFTMLNQILKQATPITP